MATIAIIHHRVSPVELFTELFTHKFTRNNKCYYIYRYILQLIHEVRPLRKTSVRDDGCIRPSWPVDSLHRYLIYPCEAIKVLNGIVEFCRFNLYNFNIIDIFRCSIHTLYTSAYIAMDFVFVLNLVNRVWNEPAKQFIKLIIRSMAHFIKQIN